ncbi:RagB/SusD family nutrient uptake outer membrane protein [Mucilaginibacter ginsenosidivorans]|uniref:RagB/SusD family nutrient uptake outer membrane protein n=1 Tax=Mucilaginibacter ginsenosidivorans TaxID=398053 RepID=A0A5B8UXL3_9SPHI|nr:RagB/SusD family nutrient uptake outer membrane protein [Mucilaginibacter ginsenosidivorans]QEC63648.1 RagB/SusD family nutrient uptake outer membrane protein [Mucilaginibacter ginsenosidivorans]
MKNKLLFLALLAIAAGVITCKKPHVKPSDPNQGDSLLNNTPKTKAGVENLLLNAYGLLDGTYSGQPTATWTTGTDNWMYGSVAGGDAYRGSNITDQGDAFTLNNYIETPDNTWLDPKWQATMLGIYYSNTVLKQLPLVKDGSLSAAETAQVTAEARFLRGFFELELAKLWHNVPYIDETVVYDKGYKNISNTGAIWDKIEGDFSAAKDVLPATQLSPGRPNKYAAEAFLAKTFMFDHKYNQAQPLLTDLITNGVTSSGAKYALGRYADNFNPSTKNGPEGVFVIQAYVHDGTQGQNGNAGDILNFPTAGPAACCGFFKPSFSFANAFKTDASTGLPLLDTYDAADLKNDEGIAASDAFVPTTAAIDSRLDWSVGRRGIPYLDWGLMPGDTWSGGANSSQRTSGPYVNIKTVYYQAAQAATTESYGGWATNQATSNSYNAIRFADVLLWAAEVEVETGSLQKAEDYVNMVRSRAADPTGWVHTYKDPSNPMNGYTSAPAANYKVGLYGAAGGNPSTGFTAGGQSYARKAVYFERMIELGMEGHRFFDLQRWDGLYGGPAGHGYMAGVLNAYIAHEKNSLGSGTQTPTELTSAQFTAGRSEVYPIPLIEITASGGKLKQNPGY